MMKKMMKLKKSLMMTILKVKMMDRFETFNRYSDIRLPLLN